MSALHRRYLRDYEKEWLAKRKLLQSRLKDEPEKTTANITLRSSEASESVSPHRPNVGLLSGALPTTIDSSTNDAKFHNHNKFAYRPVKRTLDTFCGQDLKDMASLGRSFVSLRPFPTFQDMGRLDIQAMTRAIESGLPAETASALDLLVVIAGDRRWGLPLIHCADLLEILVDCLVDSVQLLEPLHERDCLRYEELLSDVVHSIGHVCFSGSPEQNSQLKHASAIQRIMSVMTILRNLASTEINQEPIARTLGLTGALVHGISAFCGLDSSAAIDAMTRLEFAKDAVTLLSLISSSLIIHERPILQRMLQFLLSFAPVVSSEFIGNTFISSTTNPYLAAAVDAATKLLSRDMPNRQVCEQLLTLFGPGESAATLNSMMALAVSVLPHESWEDNVLATLTRFPLIQHAMILIEITVEICSSTVDSSLGWLQGLSSLSCRLLSLHQVLSKLHLTTNQISEAELMTIMKRIVLVIRTILRNGTVSHDYCAAGSYNLDVIMQHFDADIHM